MSELVKDGNVQMRGYADVQIKNKLKDCESPDLWSFCIKNLLAFAF